MFAETWVSPWVPAQAPQLWHGIAQHLGQAAPDVLVLIHPMHMAPAQHSHRALQVAPPLPTHVPELDVPSSSGSAAQPESAIRWPLLKMRLRCSKHGT